MCLFVGGVRGLRLSPVLLAEALVRKASDARQQEFEGALLGAATRSRSRFFARGYRQGEAFAVLVGGAARVTGKDRKGEECSPDCPIGELL